MRKSRHGMGSKLIEALDNMGMGVLATLIVGTILRQLATLLGDRFSILFTIGTYAQVFMAVGVAIGVAHALKVKPVVMYGAVVTSMMGAGAFSLVDGVVSLRVGDPAAAFVTALATVAVGSCIAGKTKLDIMITPMVSLILGGLVAIYVAPWVTALTSWIGIAVTAATEMHPILMGIIVAIIFCFIIMSPLSSSALAIGLGLTGLAAGAALAGTAASMVGFAAISFKDNGIEGLISQGIGTSKIQFGNFVKNPAIFLPTMFASAIMGPLSTVVFRIETNSLGAGMGTSGLVGQIQTLYVMGSGAWWQIVLVQVLLPIVISLLVWKFMNKRQWIKTGDMVLPKG
ncbi:MAG: PTS sugar transporter subunit IIC [Defluviitaleaceae bacterium]|nr:PTS sugar transporter subunit IIC [Defluviitaleaceae bacterium]